MQAATSSQGTSLTLRRTFAASRETVFRAWTDPQALKQWWAPEGYSITEAAVDLRAGGSYRIGMMKQDTGLKFHLEGQFIEVERPARLVYTWAWRGSPMDPAETLVTVDFLERGRETELVLVHERFPSQGDRDQHEHGWSKVLGNLNRFLGTAAQPS